MSKKVHIGNGGTPKCSRRLSLNRSSRARSSITKTREEFLKLPRDQQCERCLKNYAAVPAPAAAPDTSDFAAGLARFIGLA